MPTGNLPTFTRQVLIVIALVSLAILAWKVAGVLILVFAGIVLAAVIRSASTPLQRRTGLSETWAVGIVSLLVFVSLVGGIYLFGREMVAQTDELWSEMQGAWGKVQGRIGDSPLATGVLESVRQAGGGESMSKIARGTFSAFGGIADLIVVIFLAIYLAADPRTYRDGLLLLLPMDTRPRVGNALDAAGTALRKWLVAQLGAMVFVGLVTSIGLAVAGVPLAIPLGILSGVLDFVPVIGPFVAAIPGLIIALGQGPEVALYALAVYATVQFVEGNLVIPLAQKWAVQMPPALALVAIVAFGVIFGLPGVLFALPLAVVTVVLVKKLYVERME